MGIGAACFMRAATCAEAPAHCDLKVIVEIPVTMKGLTPVVDAKVNGRDVPLILDSGAFFSTLSQAAAEELKLPTRLSSLGTSIEGFAGFASIPEFTSVSLTLAGRTFPRKFDFMVGGADFAPVARGLLGQDSLLGIWDVEYDLANGVVRLIKPGEGCHGTQLLYWAGGQAYSVVDINRTTRQEPHTIGSATVNGSKIRVIFDTGAGASYLSLHSAERAGVKPDSPGVTPGGHASGLQPGSVKTWIAPFQSFKIGDEEIRNTHLRIGELDLEEVSDMLIGADFFLSHRVYVANSEHKLYFTYNGGPVFNLSTQPDARETPIPEGQPTTADEFFRRGAAYLARHDYTHALADLQRACELNPQEPKYFFERATVYWRTKQLDLSDADIDTTLKLQPDNTSALFWRAQRKLRKHDDAGAIADFNAVDHAAAPQANIRLALGRAYQQTAQFTEALKQYDLWIDAHHEDVQADVHASRCLMRALTDQARGESLFECNRALDKLPDNPEALTGRGLIYLRLGKFDQAIPDYSGALKQQPDDAWALFGRALAERELKKASDAQSDYKAALAIAPNIVEEFRKRGIVP